MNGLTDEGKVGKVGRRVDNCCCISLSIVCMLTCWYVYRHVTTGTLRSDHYNEQSFQRIEIGMSRSGVLALLGPPLSKHFNDAHDEIWVYAKKRTDYLSWGQKRRVWFDAKTGQVFDVEACYNSPFD